MSLHGGWSASGGTGLWTYRRVEGGIAVASVTQQVDGFHAATFQPPRQDRIFKTLDEAKSWCETLLVERELER